MTAVLTRRLGARALRALAVVTCAVVAFAVVASGLVALAPGAGWAAPRSAGWVPPLDRPLLVRRAFEPPRQRWLPGHRGVDLAAYPGAAVRAAGAGTVTFAGILAGRGVLVVTHGALRTTYEPVAPLAAEGDAVGAGDVVALLAAGHDGPSWPGEALLHWGLLRGETYLDPLALLSRGPSRLLPVGPADAVAAFRSPAVRGAAGPGPPDAAAGYPAAADHGRAAVAARSGAATPPAPTSRHPRAARDGANAATAAAAAALAWLAVLRRAHRNRGSPRSPTGARRA